MEKDILSWLVDQAPVIVVLGIAIWWLAKRLEKKEAELKQAIDRKEEEIRDLQKYAREKTIELLGALKDTVRVLDKVTEGQQDVRSDIKSLHDSVLARIDKLEIDTLRDGTNSRRTN